MFLSRVYVSTKKFDSKENISRYKRRKITQDTTDKAQINIKQNSVVLFM